MAKITLESEQAAAKEWQQEIKLLMAKINHDYGVGTAVRGDQVRSRRRYFSTGSTALDIALCGGWAEDYITEIRGPYSAGKTTLLLSGLAAHQRKYQTGLAAVIDAERCWDGVYARSLGVDTARVWVINPDSGEQGVNVMRDLLNTERPTFVGIDSIAALTPAAEIEDPVEKASMGVQARMINRAMRVVTARMKRSAFDDSAPSVAILALNQLRQKIGVMFGNPETTPGGEGQNFYYGVRVRVASNASGEVKQEVTRNGVKRSLRMSQTVTFRVNKNKTGGPQNEEGEAIWQIRDPDTLALVLAFDNVTPLLTYGVYFGLVDVDGKTFSYETLGGKRRLFLHQLGADMSLRRQLKKQIITALSAEWTAKKAE